MTLSSFASIFLALLAALGGAKPIASASTDLFIPSLDKALPRAIQDYCTNDPTVIAGTISNKRSLIPTPSIPDNRNPKLAIRQAHPNLVVTWCLPQSPVWARIVPYTLIITQQIQFLLNVVAAIVQDNADDPQNVLVPNYFSKALYGYQVAVGTVSGQQMKWEVLEAGLYCLYEYMMRNQYTTCAFAIYDGTTMVGRGTLTPTPM